MLRRVQVFTTNVPPYTCNFDVIANMHGANLVAFLIIKPVFDRALQIVLHTSFIMYTGY